MISLISMLLLFYLAFSHYDLLVSSTLKSLNTLIMVLIPSLFLMIILVQTLKSNKIIIAIIKYIHKFTNKIFNLKSCTETFILIFSLINGNVTTVINIKQSLDRNEIDSKNATKLSTILSFPSPLYMLSSITTYDLSHKIIIFLSMYIVPLLFLMFTKKSISTNSIIDNKKTDIFKTISTSFISLVNIFSFVLFFTMITSLFFSIFTFSENTKYILSNILDLTVGASYNFDGSFLLKLFLLVFLNSFLGLSIIFQIKSIYNEINIFRFILTRLIIALLSSFMAVLLSLSWFFIFIPVLIIVIKITKKDLVKSFN